LPIFTSEAGRGDGSAVLGYPGGGQFDAAPATILRRFFATGRDIYNQNTTRRQVYQLQSRIRQGNSGGPFVRQDGTVLGVIFAASTTQGDIGYALTSTEVAPRVQQAQAAGQADTGPCAA
jgi:S1-C subfamily serine protease